jgi:hypothetical protein
MRIIAFGPSETYGHGLEDCVSDDDAILCGPLPSKFAYPTLTANKLKVECINLAKPGSGSLQTLIDILNFKFQKNDIVIAQWPKNSTVTLINDNDTSTNIQPWMALEASEVLNHKIGFSLLSLQAKLANISKKKQLEIAHNFYKTHSDRHLYLIASIYMDLAALHLKDCGVNKCFIASDEWNPEQYPGRNHIDFFVKIFEDYTDFAADGIHPGPKTHERMANLIVDYINCNINSST